MEIHKLDQWVVWKYDRSKGNASGKQSKVLYSPQSGGMASPTDSSTWASYEEAKEAKHKGYDGIGFVFTEDDPYCGIDLDGCVDADSGEIEEWADGIVQYLDSYTEITPSLTGLHIITRATKPGPKCRRGSVEIYDKARYFTVTGWSLGGRD